MKGYFRDDGGAAGTWKPSVTEDPKAVLMTCPFGHPVSLAKHEIGEAGVVSPSVRCKEPGCKFHEDVRLVGWEGPGA